MPVGSVSSALPPQMSMALQALSSALQSEQEVSAALLGGATGAAGASNPGASNPGLGQIVDVSA